MFDSGQSQAFISLPSISMVQGHWIAWPTTELSKFDDLDYLVLAGLALECAFLRTGPVRLYSCKPHWRAALGAGWMHDVFRGGVNLKLTHGDALPLQTGGERVFCVAHA